MTCPLCGERCTCAPEPNAPESASPTHPAEISATPNSTSHVEIERTPAVNGAPRPKFIVSEPDELSSPPQSREPDRMQPAQYTSEQDSRPGPASSEIPFGPPPIAEPSQPDLDSWRAEVSARLNRYRARRRPREPRYPSLQLKFEVPPARTPAAAEAFETSTMSAPSSAPFTCHALAMNPVVPVEEELVQAPEPANEITADPVEPSRAVQVLAKVLEFPRWSYAPPAPLNELADPVVERPRILEVPEVVTPPPAMGGITIEDAQLPEPERRAGIDMPLRAAPLGLRVWAVTLDWFIVLLASAMFGYLFYRISGTQPPLWELIGLGAGLPCIFWAAYQYLFTVYCGTTPGLRAAHLSISRFDGSPVNRRTRRLRVLCGLLSGISLGMGYAWQFLDEDRLCWHERVTRTYLAPPS
jgi:uncharacterized RDD family membrane protein YckC